MEYTGADGAYSLRIADDPTTRNRADRVVNVCWPTGTWPAGRWWRPLTNIADAKAVHFPLRSDKQTLPFMYFQITDDHGDFQHDHTRFAKFVNGIAGEVKFVLETGDTGTPALVAATKKKFNVHFFHAIGNHDVHPDKTTGDAGYGPYMKHLGPVRWSFDYASVHFVGVDVTQHASQTTADWLEKDLNGRPRNSRVILSFHYPSPVGCPKFIKLLRDHKVTMIHAGHPHTYTVWDNWHAPLVMAYTYRGNNANVGIIGKDTVDVALLCNYCRRGTRHSRRCPIAWQDHAVLSSLGGRISKDNKAAGVKGANTTGTPVPIDTRDAYVRSYHCPCGHGGIRRVMDEKSK